MFSDLFSFSIDVINKPMKAYWSQKLLEDAYICVLNGQLEQY